MTETLTGFQTYVRFVSCDPAKNRLRFYYPDREQAQAAIRQLVRRLAHGYQVIAWQ